MEQKGERNYLLKLPGEEHENSFLVQEEIENSVVFFYFLFCFPTTRFSSYLQDWGKKCLSSE